MAETLFALTIAAALRAAALDTPEPLSHATTHEEALLFFTASLLIVLTSSSSVLFIDVLPSHKQRFSRSLYRQCVAIIAALAFVLYAASLARHVRLRDAHTVVANVGALSFILFAASLLHYVQR